MEVLPASSFVPFGMILRNMGNCVFSGAGAGVSGAGGGAGAGGGGSTGTTNFSARGDGSGFFSDSTPSRCFRRTREFQMAATAKIKLRMEAITVVAVRLSFISIPRMYMAKNKIKQKWVKLNFRVFLVKCWLLWKYELTSDKYTGKFGRCYLFLQQIYNYCALVQCTKICHG